MRERHGRLTRHENRIAFLFILIPLIGFMLFTVGAMIFTIKYSLENYNSLTGASTYVGLDNYKNLFTHVLYAKSFKNAIINTVVLLLSIPISMLLGLCLAGLLRLGSIKGSKIFQVLYYIPVVSSAVALNLVWRYIFNNEYGLINQILGQELAWIGDNTLIKVAIIIKNSLNGIGNAMILYLAGMLNIPKDYYEAAEIDGASRVQQFFKITLPLITPMTFYLLITGLIGGLQSYADSQIFANGQEGAQTIVYFIWARGIDQGNFSLASAASVLLAVVIMIITLVQFRTSNKWVYEE